jgi:hypothetical protein
VSRQRQLVHRLVLPSSGGLGVSGYGKEGGRDEFLGYKTVSIIEPQ